MKKIIARKGDSVSINLLLKNLYEAKKEGVKDAYLNDGYLINPDTGKAFLTFSDGGIIDPDNFGINIDDYVEDYILDNMGIPIDELNASINKIVADLEIKGKFVLANKLRDKK